jgi:2-keto-4-pentenoate hydratase/2-oxohepta-3-ene-1,7-dioic acid hydratase in catechol pathway
MKIICVGRNYCEHAKEMNAPVPENPVVFLKPDTSLIRNNQPFFYPNFSKEIHYELEIVLKLNRLGRNIAERFAPRYFSEIALGVDFTARDIQQQCKEQGLPWEISKAFDGSAPISKFVSIDSLNDIGTIDFWLEKNGVEVLRGNSSQMIFNYSRIIAYVSQFFTLKIGDLIFTGTPAGVGPVAIGDRLKGYMNGNLMLDFFVR